MKRKLDENDSPTVEVAPTPQTASFGSFNLDPRLLQAVAKEQYSDPTPVQVASIPLTLEGKDVLAKAKTGSGKTAAYVLPILHAMLQRRKAGSSERTVSTLVLVPTRELAEQVHQAFKTFSAFCLKEVRSVNLTQRVAETVLTALLQDSPDIVVSTPSRATQCVASGALKLDRLERMVIDEADLVLSYGYEDDVKTLSAAIPRGVQSILMSATLTDEIETLKTLLCRDPVVLNLEDKEEDNRSMEQYVVKCAEDEKFLLLYVVFKLKLVRGKCIIFVGDVDRSYRLKLYLEQFGIRSCILNSELPINSRLHVVQEFNKGVYDIIIAADEQEVLGGIVPKSSKAASAEEVPEENASADGDEASKPKPTTKPRTKQQKAARDYGVSRGIDFQDVACVLNFDLPTTSKSYTHRIGRTARAGKTGIALSFVVPKEQFGKHKHTSLDSTRHDERVLEKIMARQAKRGMEVKPYHFDMAQVDAFRYRMNDAIRAVTRVAVRDARAREIKQELVRSEKLKRHFEENPDDLRHLRHDGESRVVRVQGHLKHVPKYLMPSKGRQSLSTADDVGFVGMRKESDNKYRRARMQKKMKGKLKGKGGQGGKGGGRVDPLKSFKAKRSK